MIFRVFFVFLLKDVNIFFRDVNNDIMEMLIMAYACRTSSARKIIGVMPYLPYCKQSKMRKRGSIVSKLLATMMSRAGKRHDFISIIYFWDLLVGLTKGSNLQ